MPNPKRSTRFKLKTIVEALEWWLEGGYNGPKTNAVGAIVQREAQRILGVTGDMHFLKNEAKARLEGIKLDRAMKQMSEKVQRELTDSLFKEFTYTKPKLLMPKPGTTFSAFPWRIPEFFSAFPWRIPELKRPTRKEELENMTEDQIYKLFKKTQKAEIRKDRIKYILEAEKGDK
jgi:hypothetical protein